MSNEISGDWRLQGQEEYLLNARLFSRAYRPWSEEWTHDHCEFCWARFSLHEGDLAIGYSTEDHYYWICPACYLDFKHQFGWVVTEPTGDSNPTRGFGSNGRVDSFRVLVNGFSFIFLGLVFGWIGWKATESQFLSAHPLDMRVAREHQLEAFWDWYIVSIGLAVVAWFVGYAMLRKCSITVGVAGTFAIWVVSFLLGYFLW